MLTRLKVDVVQYRLFIFVSLVPMIEQTYDKHERLN